LLKNEESVTQVFHNGSQVMVATIKLSKWWLQVNH